MLVIAVFDLFLNIIHRISAIEVKRFKLKVKRTEQGAG
jgi:hypothetical protein